MNDNTLPSMPKGKTGYVALLGRPNTGKSTLVNTVLGCHLAAVSSKPQTTRRAMLGIYNDDDAQIIFLDAPGIHQEKIALDEAMGIAVRRVLDDADVVLCLIDPTRVPGEEDGLAAAAAASCGKKVLLVLNKCDLTSQKQRDCSLEFYRKALPEAEVFLLTATKPESAQALMQRIKALLPVELFLYERDVVTTAYERDLAADLVHEALLECLNDEIPHCIAVTIDSWQSSGKELNIRATLNLEREAHKGIVIGQGGRMLRTIRQAAAAKISELCPDEPVRLSLFVKVVPNWRKHKQFLKNAKLWE